MAPYWDIQHFDFEQIKSDVINLLDLGICLCSLLAKQKLRLKVFVMRSVVSVPFIYENGAGVENFNLIFGCEEAPYLHQNPKAIRTDALLTIWEQYISLGLKSRCHFVKDMDRGAQQACLGLGAKL